MRQIITALLGATVLSIVCAPAALAADMPVKAPVYKAPVAIAPSWTGFYIGGHAGYGWSRASTQEVGLGTILVIPAQTVGALPTSLSPRVSGFVGGGQLGYNWQSGQYVTGLELDISYSGLRGDDALIAPVIGGNPPLTTTQSNRIDWLGTVRGRLGWLVAPSILIYGTGGLAYGGVMASTTIVVPTPPGTCPAGSAFCSVGSQSATRAGWTVGAGLESAISSNWTVKLEYLYFNLGTLSYPVIVTSTGTFGGTTDMMASAKFDGQIVRVGLNYKFGQ